MSRVTDKHMRVEDGEDKTRPHPAPFSCLTTRFLKLEKRKKNDIIR